MAAQLATPEAGGMELRLLGASGLREGSLLSIKVGTKRCYLPYHADNLGDGSYKFPSLAGGCEHVKLDVYEPVAHARLLLDASTSRWNVALTPRPAVEADEEEGCGGGAISDAGGGGGDQDDGIMSLEFETTGPNGDPVQKGSALEDAAGCISPGFLKADGRAERKHQARLAAARAQPYMDKHNIFKVVQTLLQSVLKEQPADPYAYMIQVLHNSRQVEARRRTRPQSAQPGLQPAANARRDAAAERRERPRSAAAVVGPALLGQPPAPQHPAFSVPPKLSPKSPSAPLAHIGLPAAPPAAKRTAPRLGGAPECRDGPADASLLSVAPPLVPSTSTASPLAAPAMAAGAARNAVTRGRAPPRVASAPSLTVPALAPVRDVQGQAGDGQPEVEFVTRAGMANTGTGRSEVSEVSETTSARDTSSHVAGAISGEYRNKLSAVPWST